MAWCRFVCRIVIRDYLAGPSRGTYSAADINVFPWWVLVIQICQDASLRGSPCTSRIRFHKFAGVESIDEWPNFKVDVSRAFSSSWDRVPFVLSIFFFFFRNGLIVLKLVKLFRLVLPFRSLLSARAWSCRLSSLHDADRAIPISHSQQVRDLVVRAAYMTLTEPLSYPILRVHDLVISTLTYPHL
jgi:hypothetical protein